MPHLGRGSAPRKGCSCTCAVPSVTRANEYDASMTLQRAALWAIVVAATVYLLVAGRSLMLPFVLGLALWYMVDALADAFEQPWPGSWFGSRSGRAIRLPRPVALVAAVL